MSERCEVAGCIHDPVVAIRFEPIGAKEWFFCQYHDARRGDGDRSGWEPRQIKAVRKL